MTHSPIAAGRSERLLWLTFSTTSRGKFLKSSFNVSIRLCAKISFCKSTAYKKPTKALVHSIFTSEVTATSPIQGIKLLNLLIHLVVEMKLKTDPWHYCCILYICCGSLFQPMNFNTFKIIYTFLSLSNHQSSTFSFLICKSQIIWNF